MTLGQATRILFVGHVAIGLIVFSGPALALILGASAVAVRRRRASARVAAWVGVAALVATTAMMFALEVAAGRPLATASPHWTIADLVKLELAATARALGSAGALVATLALTAAFASTTRERIKPLAGGTLAALVYGFATWDANRVLDAGYGECTDLACRYGLLVEQGDRPIAFARTLVLATGAAFVLVGTFLRFQRRPVASGRRVAEAGVVLAAGIAAFALTRPFAADADAPVPLWDDATFFVDTERPDIPPAPAHCSSQQPGMEIEIGDTLRIDGDPSLSLPRELAAKQKLATALGRGALSVAISAPRTLTGADVAAIVAVVRGAGFREVYAVAEQTRPDLATATRGKMARSKRYCLVHLEDRAFAEGAPTWGEVVSRAGK
ncbi:hypothetical protein BH09MYX1_BH09MYX1_25420 [soil metagenome]